MGGKKRTVKAPVWFQSIESFSRNKTEWCKWVALIAMTGDHVGMFLPEVSPLRVVGRTAFPLYAFCLVAGAEKTRNVEAYLLRLLLVALLAQVPFSMVWGARLNTLWTLALGLVSILADKRYGKCCGLVVVAGALYMEISYSFLGIALVYGLWKLRRRGWEVVLIVFCVAYTLLFKSQIELWGIAALVVIMFGPGVKTEMGKAFWYPQFPVQYALIALVGYVRTL